VLQAARVGSMSEGARRRLVFRMFSDAVFGGRLGSLVHGAFDLLARLSPRPPESDPHFTEVLARAAEEARLENELRFTLLVESVTEYAVFMLDPTGHVATWNAGAQRIKGYEAREIIGQHFSIFCSDADVREGKCERALMVAARDGRCEDEGFRIRKDGTRFWAHVSITAIRTADGELVGFAKVTRDMTSTKKSEEQLLRLARAEESIRVRDEFLTIASHELRTPVTALQLQLQSLQLRTSAMEKTVAQKVERVARSVTRLSDLIESLLDASQLASGQIALQRGPLEADNLLSELIDELQAAASKAGCSLSLSAERHLVVQWDRVRIDQVMSNLIGNAIKYGPGKPIRIALRRAGEQAVRIEVDDEGPGIPEKDLTRIFGRFERASSLRHHGGLGLGLYVAHEIVEAHGGSITVRNKPGGGACFSVLLPRGRSEDDQAAAVPALH
jgi:PAS domain S-box-containing protein